MCSNCATTHSTRRTGCQADFLATDTYVYTVLPCCAPSGWPSASSLLWAVWQLQRIAVRQGMCWQAQRACRQMLYWVAMSGIMSGDLQSNWLLIWGISKQLAKLCLRQVEISPKLGLLLLNISQRLNSLNVERQSVQKRTAFLPQIWE